MLSKAASLRSTSKEDRVAQNSKETPPTVVEQAGEQPAAAVDNNGGDSATTDSTPSSMSTNGNKDDGDDHDDQEDESSSSSTATIWHRDPEKERDKILGFFTLSDQPIPRDIFHAIMSFVPAYPYYFMLRSVCSQWLYEFQEQIYGNVQYLNLVDDGYPKFYWRRKHIAGLMRMMMPPGMMMMTMMDHSGGEKEGDGTAVSSRMEIDDNESACPGTSTDDDDGKVDDHNNNDRNESRNKQQQQQQRRSSETTEKTTTTGEQKDAAKEANAVDEAQELVLFKPLNGTGKGFRMNAMADDSSTFMRYHTYNRTPIFRFLGDIFCNVKHLKLSVSSIVSGNTYKNNACLMPLLSRMPQLETLDIVGTTNSIRGQRYASESIGGSHLYSIAESLPSWVKTLNLIGICLSYHGSDKLFKIFSRAGRAEINDYYTFGYRPHYGTLECDIQHLNLLYTFLPIWNVVNFSFTHLDPYFKTVSTTVVAIDDTAIAPNMTAVTRQDYIRHMSNREGVALGHMVQHVIRPSASSIQALFDVCVKEYSYFKPLLSMSPKDVFQLSSYTPVDHQMICSRMEIVLDVLQHVTNLDNMKYPELVFHVDRTFPFLVKQHTILHQLVMKCTSGPMLEILRTFVETYKPCWTVDGTPNVLLVAITSQLPSSDRTELIEYILDCCPDLLFLGDSKGNINKDQRDLPLIQLVLSQTLLTNVSLDDIRLLVSRGASLTNRDSDGNTIVHSACLINSIECIKYIISLCSDDTLVAVNNKNQTPLENILRLSRSNATNTIPDYTDDAIPMSFLTEIGKLPYFQSQEHDQSLKTYPTSHGTLFHTAVATNPSITLIKWFLEQGFDPNALNDNGENVLFFLKPQIESSFGYYRYGYSRYGAPLNSSNDQRDYVDDVGTVLISAGARVDIVGHNGSTVIGAAIRNGNYRLLNVCTQDASIASKLHELLKHRYDGGYNALHFLFQTISRAADRVSTFNKKQRELTYGAFPVARQCALLCLEHYPEMLHEKSEPSNDESLKAICNLSPLQYLLELNMGLQILNDLSIKLSDIANKPVYVSKDSDSSSSSTNAPLAPIPVMYLALEVAIDIPLFDKLMSHTENLLVRDESQDTKPNLLHIASERDLKLCQCIIRHWKKRYKSKEEISRLVSMPLENDATSERKARNAAIIACQSDLYDIFAALWPYVKPLADQFDNPVDVALKHGHHSLAKSAVIHLRIKAPKHLLHQILRRCLVGGNRLIISDESVLVSRMNETEAEERTPSWLQLLTQVPSPAVDCKHESFSTMYLSTLQLLVKAGASYTFSWLMSTYENDPLLHQSVTLVDPLTGNTLLHTLTEKIVPSTEVLSILNSIVNLFEKRTSTSTSEQSSSASSSKRKKTRVSVDIENIDMARLAQFINVQNKDGWTCLHNVAHLSFFSVLKDFLKYGASLDIKNNEDETPREMMDRSDAMKKLVQEFLDKKEGKKPEKKSVTKKKRKEADSNDQESIDDQNDDDDSDYDSRRTTSRRKRRRTRK